MATFDTVANIVNDVAVEVGLGQVPDVYGSTDAAVVQLRTLLKSVGRGLVLENQWLQQVREGTITTLPAVSLYPLPADFLTFVDGTGWDRTAQLKMVPLSPQQWQQVAANTVTGLLHCLVRQRDGDVPQLELWPQPPAVGHLLAFEYRSLLWVKAVGDTLATKHAPTANTDVVCFDVQLATRALKLAWYHANGLESTAAQLGYEAAFDAVRTTGAPMAPVLPVGGTVGSIRLIDEDNAPETGYGV